MTQTLHERCLRSPNRRPLAPVGRLDVMKAFGALNRRNINAVGLFPQTTLVELLPSSEAKSHPEEVAPRSVRARGAK